MVYSSQRIAKAYFWPSRPIQVLVELALSDVRSCLWWLLSVLILDPTLWLDGARPANTCIPVHGEHDAHWLALVGKNWPDSREGGQV